MVGQGVVHACLRDERVTEVVLVVRAPLGLSDPEVRQIVHQDFTDFASLQGEFTGLDACFFCLGVSAAGLSEEEYVSVTHDVTLAAARVVAAAGPSVTFTYVSGEGTDSTEAGRSFWARVKGRTENELLAMDFHAYMFRPGYIRPMHGAVSRTAWYRWMYRASSWLYPVLHRLAPGHTTTTDALGRAMIAVVGLGGTGPTVLDSRDINRLGAPEGPGRPG